MVSGANGSDAVVIGGGLIGLSIARALAGEGLKVRLLGLNLPGQASPAAAGMLAPSVERSTGPAHDFAVASRDSFPAYLSSLQEETGVIVPLNRLGILQVAITPAGEKGLRKSVLPGARWIDPEELQEIEPGLSLGLGAVFSPDDGSVDNTVLLDALRKSVTARKVDMVEDRVVSVIPNAKILTIHAASGEIFECDTVVVAAGAWVGNIQGVPCARNVRPSRGQIVEYSASPLRHVVYGPRGYLVPRARGNVLAGSTMEDVGFETGTSPEGISRISSAAAEICPPLGALKPSRAWAGLRPVTPDLLPLIGSDPKDERVVYACGHSRNGVLLAPLTGEIVTDLVAGRGVGFDLTQFRPDRFQY